MEFSQRNDLYIVTNCFNCPDDFPDGAPDGIGVEDYHIRFTMQNFQQDILEIGADTILSLSLVLREIRRSNGS